MRTWWFAIMADFLGNRSPTTSPAAFRTTMRSASSALTFPWPSVSNVMTNFVGLNSCDTRTAWPTRVNTAGISAAYGEATRTEQIPERTLSIAYPIAVQRLCPRERQQPKWQEKEKLRQMVQGAAQDEGHSEQNAVHELHPCARRTRRDLLCVQANVAVGVPVGRDHDGRGEEGVYRGCPLRPASALEGTGSDSTWLCIADASRRHAVGHRRRLS